MKQTWNDAIGERLESLKQAGLWRSPSVISGLDFTHNDYLGLSRDKRIWEAADWGLRLSGAGSRGSRLLGGHSAVFERGEERIADWFGAPAALFFSTGYLANQAVMSVMGELASSIVSDERIHASLIDGIRLTRKKSGEDRWRVSHQRWSEAEALDLGERPLVVAETLYSMDGDALDFASMREAFDGKQAFFVLDEAHAAGVFGKTGRGLAQEQGSSVDWNQTALVVTFGKAFGVAGAAVLCSASVRDLLVNQARSFIYTTAPSPGVVTMVEAALDVAGEAAYLREELWDRAEQVRGILGEVSGACEAMEGKKVGISTTSPGSWDARSPIVSFRIPGESQVLRFCENMRELGVGVKAIRYPTVARGSERVRLSLNLSVSRENTLAMAQIWLKQWMEFLSQPPTPG